MEQSKFYHTIYQRKSIRKYHLNSLDEKTMSEISSYINSVNPLFKDIKTEIRVVGLDEIKLLLPIKAPHYLLFYSENKDEYLTNAGYMLQQIDLFLSSNNIGSCYLGMAQPTRVAKASSQLEFVMVLAFGNAAETLHRPDGFEFNRKKLVGITDITDNDKVLDAARLAPSATNSQPWFFTGSNGIINVYCIKSNIIKAILYEKMNKIDIGIALCHIAVALNHENKEFRIAFDDKAKVNHPKGYYYIITVYFK